MKIRAPWVNRFGFTKTPFSKSISAKDLFSRDAHQEAVDLRLPSPPFCTNSTSQGHDPSVVCSVVRQFISLSVFSSDRSDRSLAMS